MLRLDTHQHFWRYDAAEYDWISDEMSVLKRDFLPADLLPLLQEKGFAGSVAVQARQSLIETQWLLDLAEEHSFIKGVVGWVDLCSDKVEESLEPFKEHPKFVGVRHVIQAEAAGFMLQERFQKGLAKLRDFDLSYDLLTLHHQLEEACELVAKFPEQRFILDHISKPLIKNGALEPWRSHIKKLAEFPNVSCKLSGMVTEADWQNWQVADFEPYLETVLEAFGVNRLMLGSDWPVCTLAGSYKEVMRLTQDYIAHLSQDEQTAISGENALHWYGLNVL